MAAQAAAADAASAEPELIVPDAALVRDGGRDAVFVHERGVARLTTVEVAGRRGGRAVISAGVNENDEVIVNPPASLRDQDRVRRGSDE